MERRASRPRSGFHIHFDIDPDKPSLSKGEIASIIHELAGQIFLHGLPAVATVLRDSHNMPVGRAYLLKREDDNVRRPQSVLDKILTFYASHPRSPKGKSGQ